jgi:hypothetical protein
MLMSMPVPASWAAVIYPQLRFEASAPLGFRTMRLSAHILLCNLLQSSAHGAHCAKLAWRVIIMQLAWFASKLGQAS